MAMLGCDDGGTASTTQQRPRPAGPATDVIRDRFAAPETVGRAGTDTEDDLDISAGGDGSVVLAWTFASSDRGPSIRVTTRRGQGGWHAPERLSPPGEAGDPRAAMNVEGDASVMWRRFVPSKTFGSGHDLLEISVRRVRGHWSAPHRIRVRGGVPRLRDGAYRLAVAPNGDVVAVWFAHPSMQTVRLRAITQVSDGRWTKPVTLETGARLSSLDLSVADSGEAAVTWIADDGLYVARRANRGSWSQPERVPVGSAADAMWPQVGVLDDGRIIVTWEPRLSGLPAVLVTRSRDGIWSSPRVLEPAARAQGESETPELATAGDAALVVWRQRVPDRTGFGRTSVYAITQAGEGRWSAPVRVYGNESGLDVALTRTGHAFVAVTTPPDVERGIDVAVVTKPPNAKWSHPQRLTPGGSATGLPHVAAAGNDEGVVAWLSDPDNAQGRPAGWVG
jgi:hypothetical protein